MEYTLTRSRPRILADFALKVFFLDFGNFVTFLGHFLAERRLFLNLSLLCTYTTLLLFSIYHYCIATVLMSIIVFGMC